MQDRTLVKKNKLPKQVVGNAGLYCVCYELLKRGWNVLPTSRNARGVDVVIYSQSATQTHTLQVKALSKKNSVSLGNNLNSLFAEYMVICSKVFDEKPEFFIAKIDEVKSNICEKVKDGKKSYWLVEKDYRAFKDRWDKIGNG